MHILRQWQVWVVSLASLSAFAAVGLLAAPQANALTDCTSLTVPLRQLVNPGVTSNLLTPWESEAVGAQTTYGFTSDLGRPFAVSSVASAGLTPVRRLYRAANYDFAWAQAGSAELSALVAKGYTDSFTNFFASPTAIGTCSTPVLAMVKNGYHRYTAASGEAALLAAGWLRESVAFHARPADLVSPPTAPSATTFSFAVIPDTQNEVLNTNDKRMPQRVSWLKANAAKLGLTWVLHSGDLQNWDTADHIQFATNSAWLSPLDAAGIPYAMTIGNHDTGAVCPGGSACPGANTSLTVRNTTTWNMYYPPTRFGYEGLYQSGKSDNAYRTFTAGGLKWLVLVVELWPRTEVINWAKNVVATHPQHNVILLTHSFLEANGTLSTSQGGYGANSPATVWAALDDYPNVVMTFSGHVGLAGHTTLKATDGHLNLAFLQAFHDPAMNPTRIVTVDTANGTVRTEIRANWDNSKGANVDYVYPYTSTISGMRFVR